MKKILVLINCLLLVSTCCLSAKTTPSKNIAPKRIDAPIVLTLSDAVFLALRNNSNIKSAELDRVTQKYALVVANHEFEPNYKLTGSFNYNEATSNAGPTSYSRSSGLTPAVSIKNRFGTVFTTTMTNPTSGAYYNPALQLSVTQPLLRGFGEEVTEAALKTAYDQEEIYKLTLKQNVMNMTDLIMNDYFFWALADASLKVDRVTLKSYEKNVENDQVQLSLGKLAKNDIVQDKARVASQRVTIETDINSLRQTKLMLLNDMGLDAVTPIQLPENLDFDGTVVKLGGKVVPSFEKCLEITLANEPAYKMEEINLRLAQRSLMTAQDNMRWQLNFTGSVQHGAGSGGGPNSGIESITNSRNHAENAGLSLNVPVDDVQLKAALLSAKIALQKEEIRFRNLKRQIEISVLNARNAVFSGHERYKLSQSSMVLQRQTVEIARIKHEYGTISSFELIKNQEDLSDNEILNIQSAVNYLDTLRDLNATLGTTLDIWGIKLKDFEHAKVN